LMRWKTRVCSKAHRSLTIRRSSQERLYDESKRGSVFVGVVRNKLRCP